MSRSTRLLQLLRPYTSLFIVNLAATVVASVLDGATFVLLIPFLRTLFGQQALPATGGSVVERMLATAVGPLLQGGAPDAALRNVVLVLLATLVVKNALAYSGELTSLVSELVGSIKLVRAYVAERFEAERFRALADRYRKGVLRAQRYAILTSPVSEVFAGGVIVLIFAVGTRLALGPAAVLRPEVLIAFLAVALRLMSPVKSVANYPTAMAGALAAADRVFEVLDLAAEAWARPGRVPARFERCIEYRGVTFSYNGQAPVLHGVDLKVRRGQVAAVVGPSGAGKTTLVDLLPRFYEPTGGTIMVDGVPITRFTRSSLRSLMGIVSQETILLNDTVFANIAYGRSDFTLDQVQAAARAANADAFVSQLPEGYHTLLGERGTRLSGGERQRIAIARALLRDPPILILDEATSALDMESERLVQEAIDRLMKHRTTFVIAHRLATVQHADLIVVLAEGRGASTSKGMKCCRRPGPRRCASGCGSGMGTRASRDCSSTITTSLAISTRSRRTGTGTAGRCAPCGSVGTSGRTRTRRDFES